MSTEAGTSPPTASTSLSATPIPASSAPSDASVPSATSPSSPPRIANLNPTPAAPSPPPTVSAVPTPSVSLSLDDASEPPAAESVLRSAPPSEPQPTPVPPPAPSSGIGNGHPATASSVSAASTAAPALPTQPTQPGASSPTAPPGSGLATRSFGLSSQPAPQALKSTTPNYTIRKANLSTRTTNNYTTPYTPPSTVTPATPAPPATTATPATPSSVYPALHLTPLNDTFVPKQISLNPPGTKVKIGRQTNAKTVPNATNGFFDSKVLSRMHAEVWCDEGKVYIKDVKSSNGTFIDGTRLSPEAAESDIFELHTDNTVEFGIDIISDDSKTIVHHKVAAKVFIVMNADDALASSRQTNDWYRNVGENNPQQIHRRGPKSSGSGSNNGLSFDHVLSRLQGELQKSRDTGSHLGEVSSALSDVHDTLGGGIPPPPSFAHTRVQPYLLNGTSNGALHPATSKDASANAQSIAALQSSLSETQSSLAGHVGRIKDLEGLLAEHEAMKREVSSLRKQMEDAQRDMMDLLRGRSAESATTSSERTRDGRESPVAALLDAEEEEDDDDARSVSSVHTIKLDDSAAERLTRAMPNGVTSLVNGVASTAAGAAATIKDVVSTKEDSGTRDGHDQAREMELQEQNAKLSARLETLSVELDEATKLGQTLRSQHAEASSAMRALELRVHGLEKAVEGRVAEVEGKVREEAETRWNGWREAFEASWNKERESWHSERERLTAAVREWEEKKAAAAAAETDESEWDSSSEPEDDGAPAQGGASSSVATTSEGAAVGEADAKAVKAKRPRSRRRRRASTATRVSTLASGKAGVASDSDSTIGDASRVGPADGVWSGPQRGVPPGPGRRGFDGAGGTQGGLASSTALPLSAGAVVIIGIAAAWALSAKMKE